MSTTALAAAAAMVSLAAFAPAAGADVFNGRIAFSSFRTDPQGQVGDIFTMNADGTDQRQLTTNPLDDAQASWSPDGRNLAYRIRKPETPTVNFEVARMTASGGDPTRLTHTPIGLASSQPAWYRDGSGIIFRRSGSGFLSTVWGMGPFGGDQRLLLGLPDAVPRGFGRGSRWYPSWSPDGTTVLFTMTRSERDSVPAVTDRGIFTQAPGDSAPTLIYDVPGAFDSAPNWSRDAKRVAFESNADVNGGNPEHDMEIWTMKADGSDAVQLTHNALHDEGPAFSPDGTMLTYATGADDLHVDIAVMRTDGTPLGLRAASPQRDESADWQAIPAPPSDERCGDVVQQGVGAHDVRVAGPGRRCRSALRVAARLCPGSGSGEPAHRGRNLDVAVEDYGGIQRVVARRRGHGHGEHRHRGLIAFLCQPTG